MVEASAHRKPGVDHGRHVHALEGHGRGTDALGADADGVLLDGAGHEAALDGVDLGLAGVVADDHDLAGHVELVDGVHDADGGAFIGAEEALDVRVGRDDGLGQVGGLELVAATVLGLQDLDVRIGFLHPIDEAVAAVDAGAAGLVVDDDADLAGAADELGHLVSGHGGSSDVVRRGRRDGDVAVHAGVEGDDGDAVRCHLLEQRVGSLAVKRREADRVRALVVLGLQHLDLDGDVGLAGRADEVHLGVELSALVLGALLDGLPELVLEALRDDRDVRRLVEGTGSAAAGAALTSAAGLSSCAMAGTASMDVRVSEASRAANRVLLMVLLYVSSQPSSRLPERGANSYVGCSMHYTRRLPSRKHGRGAVSAGPGNVTTPRATGQRAHESAPVPGRSPDGRHQRRPER